MSKRHEQDELIVYLNGERIGTLSRCSRGLSLEYDKSAERSLSVAMPLTKKIYEGSIVNHWFSGVLPDEEGTRRMMARDKSYGHNSVFGLLSDFGTDLPGAVQVLSQDTLYDKGEESVYELVSSADIGSRLSEMIDRSNKHLNVRWHDEKEHWSLAGGQPKFALMELDGEFYECFGAAPSNVIIKPGVTFMNNQAAIEHITMSIAQETGLSVANTKLMDFNGVQALVIERYDRAWNENGEIERLHQEDLCQALGLLPEQKYMFNKNPTVHAGQLLKKHCDEAAMASFVDSVLFNYLVGGTDGHLKNHSLVHLPDGTITLAPLYDIASRFPYYREQDLMHTAFGIGHERRIGRVGKKALSDMADMLNIPRKALFNRFEALSERIPVATEKVFENLASDIPNAEMIHDSFAPRVQMNCEYAQRNLDTTHFLVPNLYAASGGVSLFDGDENARAVEVARDNAEKAIFRDPATGQVSSVNPHEMGDADVEPKHNANKPRKHHKTSKSTYTSARAYGEGPVYVQPHERGGKKISGYWRSRPGRK